MKAFAALIWAAMTAIGLQASVPDSSAAYEAFRRSAKEKYASFRKECNAEYAEFLKTAWQEFEASPAVPSVLPEPVPPVVYEGEDSVKPVEIEPVNLLPVKMQPQPLPVEPVYENPVEADCLEFGFYGLTCKVRIPADARPDLATVTPETLSRNWSRLGIPAMDNTLRDCLELRVRNRLSDWAYLQMLERLGREYCGDSDAAVFLTAYLFCQSGYRMRFGISETRNLVLLYGTRHTVFDAPFFGVDGQRFYPYRCNPERLEICPVSFRGEKPLSLVIPEEQYLGDELSESREIKSRRYPEISVASQVPVHLIEFYNSYPSSAIDGNPMTKWAICAEAPFSSLTSRLLYPVLMPKLEGLSAVDAANRLLNLVQTGLVYEYDDKVWGGDRAFFAEETLYYPYCDCEDRSVLFSRLIRDLLGLKVALIYYPGHLATAVCFDEEVEGDAVIIDGRRFLICDPTYIGAPVGRQMRRFSHTGIESVVLN